MSGDGVSLPTTLAQLGHVAKAQAKGQQGNQPVAPFSEQLEKENELRVRQVEETKQAEQGRINADEKQEKDRRRRRRMRRKKRQAAADRAAGNQERQSESDTLDGVGGLIDTRV